MEVLKEEHFVCTDVDRNNNKFWKIRRSANPPAVTTEWGRVGDSSQSKTWTFTSDVEADSAFEKKKKDKLKVKSGRDAYTQIEVLDAVRSTSNLASLAKDQIETSCEETKKLIEWLTKINIHQILSSTTMTYSAADGVFRTPLGVVGRSSIDRAQDLLAGMKPLIEGKKYEDDSLKKIVNEYLRLIPQDLGRARDKLRIDKIFADSQAFQKQVQLVEQLEASIRSVVGVQPSADRVFNVKLEPVTNDSIVGEITSLFNKTKQSRHVSSSYHPYQVWSVDIQQVRESYEKDGKNLDNVWRLWHGTKPHNLLSILKVGLVIPSKYVNGWNFGPGVYFSDQSTKSLNYAAGYWDGKCEDRAFMFVADVGMGKYKTTSSTFNSVPSGYDSCFARGSECKDSQFDGIIKCGSLLNNEMIAYRCSQANLVYLVEFRR